MAGATSRITVEIGGKLAASLTSSLRAAQAQVSSFSRNVTRTFNDAATAGAKGFKGMLRNDAFQIAAAGAASIGLALGQSVRTAATFETSLTEIGKVAGSSQSELKRLGAQLSALSARNATNLAPTVLAEGVQDLVAQGLNLKDAVASMEALGKVATATGSELTDVTKTGFQLQNALKIRPTELKATFDALAFAGKQGAFELKDMAQFMPTIAAAAGTLGIQGKQGAVALASMMQMVRKDAPDAGQAATRLTDAMLKLTAPDAVKRFKKFGVNIEQVLANAKKRGVNPMEAALDELQRVTGGDVFKLSQIFGDKEAKLGLMSLMKYRKEYEKLKADAGGDAAAGTVEQDYLKSINTLNGNLNTFKATTERLGIALGNALLPAISTIAKAITPMVEGFASLAEKAPLLTNTLVGVGAAFVGLVAAAPFIASFIEILGALKMALATTSLGATIAGWAGAIGPAMAAIGTAITGPVGIAVLAVVGLGLAFKAAYDKVGWFRDGVNSAMAGIGQAFGALRGMISQVGQALWAGGLGQMVQGIQTVLQGVANVARGIWQVIVGIFTGNSQLAVQGVNTAFAGLRGIFSGLATYAGGAFNLIQTAGSMAWNHIKTTAISAFQGIVAFIRSVPAMVVGVGQAIIDTIINGIKARASALVAAVKGVFANVRKMMPFSDAKEGPFKYLTASGKSIITTLADGVHEASPRLHGAIHAAASHGLRGMDRARANYQPQALARGQGLPQIAGASAPITSQPFIPQYPGSSAAPQVAAPAPAMAMAGGGTMGMTMSPTININVAGSSASAQEIADQVRYAFQDILGQAESSVRAFLND
jgi:TP901 family phage tail tape measure protein